MNCPYKLKSSTSPGGWFLLAVRPRKPVVFCRGARHRRANAVSADEGVSRRLASFVLIRKIKLSRGMPMKFDGTNHNTTKLSFCLILIISFCINSAFAWDGHRKGFILGVGIGPTHTSQEKKTEISDFYSEVRSYEYDKRGVGLQYSLKIGYAPNERIQL